MVKANSKDTLGDRMKGYEEAARTVLAGRMPVVIRVDGKAFHTYTKGCKKPWDDGLIEVMNDTALQLCKSMQGAQVAYVQSDEISVLLHGYKKITSSPWFDNQVQKMVSVAASIAGVTFSVNSSKIWPDRQIRPAYFDARAFVLPENDVCNYFLWRQQDASRNSIQMLARSLYSHKELDGKNSSQLQELCFQKGKNWNDQATSFRRGRCIVKEDYSLNDGSIRSRWIVDNDIPIFSEDREYINKFLALDDEK